MKITHRKSLAYYRLRTKVYEKKLKETRRILESMLIRFGKLQKRDDQLVEQCRTMKKRLDIATKFNAEEIAETNCEGQIRFVIRVGDTWYRPINEEPMNENSQWHLTAVKPQRRHSEKNTAAVQSH